MSRVRVSLILLFYKPCLQKKINFYIYANEEHLSKISSLNEKEIVVEIVNDFNENLVIEKEIVDDGREQPDPDLVVMKNSGNNLMRDSRDGLLL